MLHIFYKLLSARKLIGVRTFYRRRLLSRNYLSTEFSVYNPLFFLDNKHSGYYRFFR